MREREAQWGIICASPGSRAPSTGWKGPTVPAGRQRGCSQNVSAFVVYQREALWQSPLGGSQPCVRAVLAGQYRPGGKFSFKKQKQNRTEYPRNCISFRPTYRTTLIKYSAPSQPLIMAVPSYSTRRLECFSNQPELNVLRWRGGGKGPLCMYLSSTLWKSKSENHFLFQWNAG